MKLEFLIKFCFFSFFSSTEDDQFGSNRSAEHDSMHNFAVSSRTPGKLQSFVVYKLLTLFIKLVILFYSLTFSSRTLGKLKSFVVNKLWSLFIKLSMLLKNSDVRSRTNLSIYENLLIVLNYVQ